MKKLLLAGLSTLFLGMSVQAQEADISVVPVAGQVYMLQGDGGNISVLATDDGLLLVDDKYAHLAEKIEQAMKGIKDTELKYIVNTHYHGDHTGSNHYFSHQAPIFAHKNVRTRLKNNDKLTADSLPVVTYEEGITIYLSDEEIKLTHLPNGHTDSDTFVYFNKTNVLHTGDLFFEVGFPYIDLNGGGTVKGYLANVHYLIDHMPDNVVIIPGHGKLSDKEGLKAFAEMISYSIDLVSKALKAGKTESEIIAMGVDQKYKHLSWNFISEEIWLKTLITDLSASNSSKK